MNNDNRCEMCGKIIPEGMMICPNCYSIDWDAEDRRLMRKRAVNKIKMICTAFIATTAIIIIVLLLTVKSFAVTAPVRPMIQDPSDKPMIAIAEPITKTDDVQVYRITAYCPCELCCGNSSDGITATGATAKEGRTIAVDPAIIPFGSIVVIDGHEYIAEDKGGAIRENRIDIFFNSHSDALAFGVRHEEVSIKNK